MASKNPVARAYNGFITCLAVISGFIFGLMAFFIGADVFMRNVMGSGMSWVIEAMEYAMYVATVFAAPWVLREGSHVSVDVLTSMLPERFG
jgi:TRAP-type C4-dicarboxylate transport system permease small subunit